MKMHVKFDLGSVPIKAKQVKKATIAHVSTQLLDKSSAYVPYESGTLLKSGFTNSIPEKGRLIWKTKYARKQWRKGKAKGIRGRKWAFRAWKDNRKIILQNTKYRMKGGIL